ncbi:hypothetical protein [Biostraticola tofi]|uniref:Antibiotic biosynthesis monooxygenase n=1 Tax=Biostraticola tofi TaxID=466109 RepID=A0A4R3YZY2_9GAMM|nr:hypothetical protein [Biostraticola tofi]TCV98216.1 hypothetical protein EDC52_103307 [Biostraticola tofi]
MIVRTWHGCVPVTKADGFAEQLQITGVDHAKGIVGNLGATVKQVSQEGYVHFFLATYWRDLEAVQAFAGHDYSVAVTYPDDEQFELLSDPYVFHHEVSAVRSL